MRFCPWYPLAEADAHAPAGEGVLQIRIADGLIEYPSGKSAMVHYEHAADVRAAAAAFAQMPHAVDLLARHLEIEAGETVSYAEIHGKLLAEFVRRFGAPPGGVP